MASITQTIRIHAKQLPTKNRITPAQLNVTQKTNPRITFNKFLVQATPNGSQTATATRIIIKIITTSTSRIEIKKL